MATVVGRLCVHSRHLTKGWRFQQTYWPAIALIGGEIQRQLVSSARSTTTSVVNVQPENLKSEHVAKLACVPKGELHSLFPMGLPRGFAKQVDILGRGCWVVRKESYDIIKDLKEKDRAEGRRVMFSGRDGSGKTMALSQVMWYCAKTNWICLHVPSVFSWTHKSSTPRPSKKEGTFDQPQEAVRWLKLLKALNPTHLSELQLSQDHQWSKREHSLAGEKLSAVVDLGLLNPLIATEISGVVVKEIVSVADRAKVLVAIDEMNGLYGTTSLQAAPKQWILPNQLNLVRNIRSIVVEPSPLVVIGALSRTGIKRQRSPTIQSSDLLGQQGIKECIEFQEINIPNFSYDEFSNCVQHYYESGWFMKAGMNVAKLKEIWTLISGNPREMEKVCSAY